MIGKKLIATSSPHIRSEESVNKVMLDVIIALLPAMIASVYYFGMNSVKIIAASVVSAVLTEAVIQKIMKKKITVTDLSAVLTGILLAFNLPSTVPIWIPVIGSAFAIAIGKQVFGGLGNNFINPALAGRAMLMASWPSIMTTWINPFGSVLSQNADTVSAATPMAIIIDTASGLPLPPISDLVLGRIPGCLGETSAALLIIGGIYLIMRKVISWKIPAAYIGTVAVVAFITQGNITEVGYHVFGGGRMLGAIFMATDYASSPVTQKGKIIFGIGAGLLTMLIRLKGALPEGVSYSILFMNVATPLIEKYTAPKVFGTGGKK